MAINISVQKNGGLLPEIILLTQVQRAPRIVFFPCLGEQSNQFDNLL